MGFEEVGNKFKAKLLQIPLLAKEGCPEGGVVGRLKENCRLKLPTIHLPIFFNQRH
jgi:hypothetical protein